jgi:diguanylate cyclase (GGDEF)-like protein
LELEREVMRAHRTGKSFVLAFVDVDGLKSVNDSEGHAGGDELLRQVVDTIRGVVRDYDLIVRYGGDEFLCGLADIGLSEADRRFETANAGLAVTRDASVTVGLAEVVPEESLDDLIARADAAMYAQRDNRSRE